MYQAYITRIVNVRPHMNADRLQICEVFGNSIVVDNSFKENDLVIYFPTDGQLSQEYCSYNHLCRKTPEGLPDSGYLDPDKRNVKTIRLRGELSDGLVMPLSSLDYIENKEELEEGMSFNSIAGKVICQKYIPHSNRHYHSTNKAQPKAKTLNYKFPFFAEHIDTPQLRFNMDKFKEGDYICLTEKVHGTSSRNAKALKQIFKRNIFDRLFKREGKIITLFEDVIGTRRTVVTENDRGYYGDNDFRVKWGNKFKDKLFPGEEVFGEIAGYVNETTPIMGVCENNKVKDKKFLAQYGENTIFSYGCEPGENRFFIYRMTYTSPNGYVFEYPWDLVKSRAFEIGFEVVPELERFIYTTEEDFLERIQKYLDIPSTIDNRHIIEGVVVRALNDPGFKVAKEKSVNFKILEGIIKENSDVPDIEEAEELLNEENTAE